MALPSRSWRRLQLSIVAGRLSLWYDDVRLVDGWLLNVPPIVSSIHPPTASAAGGTSLTLRGSGFGGASALLRCRFGGVVVSAEPLAADDQHHLLHAVRLHLRRRARGHGRRLLRASAARHLPNGSLELTPSSAYDAEGTAVCAAPQGVRYGGAAHLVLSFELELGRDGDGASVSYGKLPEDGGLGAGGASLGLSLRFLSRLRPPRCSMTTKSSTLSRCRPRRAEQASRWRRR